MANEYRRQAVRGLMVLATVGLTAAGASAQSYGFTLDRSASSLDASASVSAPVEGTFIGDYDPKTNPGGTQTRPGAFGGSGNNPIPYAATLTGDGTAASQPDGAFTAAIDESALTIDISDLTVDLLNGEMPASDATVLLSFETFNTINPSAIFFGASNVPVTLGEFVITSLTATQVGASQAGSLTSQGGGSYLFSAIIPIDVALVGEAAGESVDGTFPVALALEGTLLIHGDDTATLTAETTVQIDEADTGPFEPISDVPLDVPTILPPGEIAHLLLSGQIQSITTVLDLTASLAANGVTEPSTPGDLNGDGVVNVLDLLIVLGEWGPCAGCDADLNGDDVVDVLDLLALLSNWG